MTTTTTAGAETSFARRLLCRLRRHHRPMLQITDSRMFLSCAACGYESSGLPLPFAPRPPVPVRPRRPRDLSAGVKP